MKMNPSTVQDFIEHYNNLTIKSVMLLKYVFRLDILPTFIIKVSKSFHKKYVDKIFPILKPPPPPCKLNLKIDILHESNQRKVYCRRCKAFIAANRISFVLIYRSSGAQKLLIRSHSQLFSIGQCSIKFFLKNFIVLNYRNMNAGQNYLK